MPIVLATFTSSSEKKLEICNISGEAYTVRFLLNEILHPSSHREYYFSPLTSQIEVKKQRPRKLLFELLFLFITLYPEAYPFPTLQPLALVVLYRM